MRTRIITVVLASLGVFFGVSVLHADPAATLPESIAAPPAATTAPGGPRELAPPFEKGTNGFAIYRIPSLVVSKAGTLLAFAEARRNIGDQAENKIVLRRSGDQGNTWGALQLVADGDHAALNNPTAVVLRESGRVLLMFQKYPQGTREGTVKPGVSGDKTCLSYILSSDDDGQTWSQPADITTQVKRPTIATSVASGPGIGIELQRGPHAGRIIMPFNQGPPNHWQVYAVYSDDGGKSWKYGELAPTAEGGRGNEIQMVELSDGRVMLNTRGSSGPFDRKTALSGDAGETWSVLHDEPAMPDSRCQGSIIRDDAPGANGCLLFVNPAVHKGRTNGTLRASMDDGQTWPFAQVVVPGDFAYSCLAVLPNGSILCLYEGDDYGKIGLLECSLQWIEAGHQQGQQP